MLVIRPAVREDMDDMMALARLAGFGLTTLPENAEVLGRRIENSLRAFAAEVSEPAGEEYMLVLEDLPARRVIGTSAIVSAVGTDESFYTYRLEQFINECPPLKIRVRIGMLRLLVERDGPCEIGSLYLHPDHRRDGNGRLLALSRFLLIAQAPQRFKPSVIAEMRGIIDDGGYSPFWEAVGRRFFRMDFPEADRMVMIDKRFIADLVPRLPIYLNLLPPEAQEVIGQIHPETQGAVRILEQEGFTRNGQVDIFEGGPVLECPRDQVRTVRHSRLAVVTELLAEPPPGKTLLLSNDRRDLRVCKGTLRPAGQGVAITGELADALQIRRGAAIRYVPIAPARATSGAGRGVGEGTAEAAGA